MSLKSSYGQTYTYVYNFFLYKMMKGWVISLITKCWLTFVQWAYSTETVIAIIINHNLYSSMPWWIAASKHSLINLWIGLAQDRKKWTSVLPKESKTAQMWWTCFYARLINIVKVRQNINARKKESQRQCWIYSKMLGRFVLANPTDSIAENILDLISMREKRRELRYL